MQNALDGIGGNNDQGIARLCRHQQGQTKAPPPGRIRSQSHRTYDCAHIFFSAEPEPASDSP